MEKQGRKRPACWSDGEEVKSAGKRNIDDEVEEFFAIIRRIRAASRLLDTDNHRNPSFRLEDFAACNEDSRTVGGRSEGTLSSGEVEEENREKIEDNGLPACLTLSVGPCGDSQQRLVKRRGGGSEMQDMAGSR